MKNADPDLQNKRAAQVLAVLGYSGATYSHTALEAMRLDPEKALLYNQIMAQVSDLLAVARYDAASNTVCCVSVAADGQTLVAQPLLKRSDVRVLQKKLDMDVARLAYRKAQQTRPELPDLEGDNARLLYWAIKEGVLKTRTNPHLASSGKVLPMHHVVLMQPKSGTARSMVHDTQKDHPFRQALGPLIVFRSRRRTNATNENNLALYDETFHARIEGLRQCLGDAGAPANDADELDVDTGADEAVDDDGQRADKRASDDEDDADGDDDYDDEKEKKKKKSAKPKKKKDKGKKKKSSKKAHPPKKQQRAAIDEPVAAVKTDDDDAAAPKKKIKLNVAPSTPPQVLVIGADDHDDDDDDDEQPVEEMDVQPVNREPVKPAPVKPEPVKPERVKQEPVKPERVEMPQHEPPQPLKFEPQSKLAKSGGFGAIDDFISNFQML